MLIHGQTRSISVNGPWPGPAGPSPWLALGLALGLALAGHWPGPWLALGLALGWRLAWPLVGPWPGPFVENFRMNHLSWLAQHVGSMLPHRYIFVGSEDWGEHACASLRPAHAARIPSRPTPSGCPHASTWRGNGRHCLLARRLKGVP